jgi:hypothetical protein
MFKQILSINLVHQNFIPFLYLTSWRDTIQINSQKNTYINLKYLIRIENGLINKIDIQEIEKENRTINAIEEIEVIYIY